MKQLLALCFTLFTFATSQAQQMRVWSSSFHTYDSTYKDFILFDSVTYLYQGNKGSNFNLMGSGMVQINTVVGLN